jgi:hypothetical protein
MGRKGVSKRKPTQTKSKPFSNEKVSGSVSSAMQAVESQPMKTIETAKVPANRKKNSKNG